MSTTSIEVCFNFFVVIKDLVTSQFLDGSREGMCCVGAHNCSNIQTSLLQHASVFLSVKEACDSLLLTTAFVLILDRQ